MALSRRIARPLLASIFVVGGFDAVRSPAGKVDKARAVTEPLREETGMAALDTEAVVRINGAVQIVAGVLLATGTLRRLACFILMGSLIPTTYAGHRFWEETDETARSQQRMHFLKNLGLLGGLILAALDTEGAPSLGWRAKRRVHRVEDVMLSGLPHPKAHVLGGKSQAMALSASKTGRHAIRGAHDVGDRARRRLGVSDFDPAEKLAAVREGLLNVQSTVADSVADTGGGASHAVQQATALVANAARQLEPLAENKVQAGVKIASEALSKLDERLSDR
jgi:putative oxidoreductase